MKIQTIGKIQIAIAVLFLLGIVALNIAAYITVNNIAAVPAVFAHNGEATITAFQNIEPQIISAAILSAEILLATDILSLILITALILNGLAMLSEE